MRGLRGLINRILRRPWELQTNGGVLVLARCPALDMTGGPGQLWDNTMAAKTSFILLQYYPLFPAPPLPRLPKVVYFQPTFFFLFSFLSFFIPPSTPKICPPRGLQQLLDLFVVRFFFWSRPLDTLPGPWYILYFSDHQRQSRPIYLEPPVQTKTKPEEGAKKKEKELSGHIVLEHLPPVPQAKHTRFNPS